MKLSLESSQTKKTTHGIWGMVSDECQESFQLDQKTNKFIYKIYETCDVYMNHLLLYIL